VDPAVEQPIRAASICRFESSLAQVVSWVREHRYRAYEPADGNASPLHRLTNGRVFAMRILQQVVLRSPFHIRPWLGVAPHESAIARGYMAAGYLAIHPTEQWPDALEEAECCLRWLIENRASGHDEFCWGDPYEYATRSGRRPYGEPLLIWTALIGQAFLDAYDRSKRPEYIEVAESVGRWILRLPAERTSTGSCLSYVAFKQSSIHNSNAMGAAFLARLGASTGSLDARASSQEAMTYTCARQRADGGWYYAEQPKYHWIDNFHTGYNLCALKTYRDALKDRSFDKQLERGLQYFKTHFFEPDGRPRYFHDRTSPVDIQCAAQAIETLARLSAHDEGCLPLAVKVADWTVGNMQADDGHFFYRDLGWMKVKTPMMHWGQATMVKALAVLLRTLAANHA
jgi:hypothetical protein